MPKPKVKKQPKWGMSEEGGLIATSQLTSALTQLLRSPATQQINFIFNAIIVTGSRFAQVAKAIDNFEIIVYHDPKLTKVPDAYSGFYSAVNDAIYLGFKDLRSMDNRMLTIHECVHAINDVTNSNGVYTLDDECAAYVACALYYRLCGNKWPSRPKATVKLVDNIYQAAFDLADATLDKVLNPWSEIAAMRAAILAVPIYKNADKTRPVYNGLTHSTRSGLYGLVSHL